MYRYTKVEEEDAAAFARRMQCAFLLFLSWAYMALASINVEYYNCQPAGEDRIVLVIDPTVGGYTSENPVDPQFETARFQPLSLPLDPS